MIEWERGDPASRGPKPVDPETHDKRMKERGMDPTAAPGAAGGGGGMGGGGGRKAQYTDAYNQAQMEAFNQNALSPCPNCGRTFLPDRLQVHLRSCKPGSAAKPPPRAAAKSSTAPVSNPVTTNTNTEASTAAPTKSPSAARPSTGPTEKPIRASGSYAIPESAGEDSVPPGAAPKGAAAQAVSKRPSQSRKTPVTVNEKRVDSDEDSEGEIQFEEEPLMPPSVMQGRRSSMSAVQHEVEHETSSPSRPLPWSRASPARSTRWTPTKPASGARQVKLITMRITPTVI
ncbi:hypothetical protein AGDE_16333 [Angomonas deanei]|uniref:Zinc-finger of a C2HC-type, putative n=1 Tax=Angomonas deanei TaxID=59799 RepID=A0A7G2CAA0_9TRYP|nr:hypothetical protein AGDE_16333 [Angomonas deanei]CAD2215991.1 zinc-finger of a C2HC-type, putative [Angomonas deanei]|eukprot:EPY17301.1 hypothetical protein AGDE_16333 [Angomonas deanei]